LFDNGEIKCIIKLQSKQKGDVKMNTYKYTVSGVAIDDSVSHSDIDRWVNDQIGGIVTDSEQGTFFNYAETLDEARGLADALVAKGWFKRLYISVDYQTIEEVA